MPIRPRRPPAPLLGGALCLGAALAAASIVRVPDGSVGWTGGALLEPGWHVRPPFARAAMVPLTGRIGAVDVERRTPEGATILVRVSVDYRIDPGLLAERLLNPGPGGTVAPGDEWIADLVSEAAEKGLEGFPAAALLRGGPVAGGADAALPEGPRGSIAEALRSFGIEPLRISARAGPADGPDRRAAAPGPREGRLPMPAVDDTGVRLLLIGLDGADWEVIDPLLEKGRLPNLARLVRGGVRARLRSYDPMISPLLWTTVVTGVGPDRHGVADFQAIDPASGRRVPISSRFRRVKALWNILGDAGLATGFVAWWASYPAEAVRGFQVSNLVAYETLRPRADGALYAAGLTHPSDYLLQVRPDLITAADITYEEVRSVLRIGREEFLAARREVLRPAERDEERANRKIAQRPVPLVLSILTGSRNYAAIASDLAARRLDVTAVYFEGIDMMGHRFQHCMPPRLSICPDPDYARLRDAVTSFYVRQDALIGMILEAAGPDATVMVVSDHGFRTGDGRPAGALPFTTRQPVEWHDPEGIFLLSGPGARRGESLTTRPTLFDIAPTVLHLVGLPIADDMSGRILLEALDPAFMERHPVRSVPSYEDRGRAAENVVADGAEVRRAEEQLLADLRALGYIAADGPRGTAGGEGAAGGYRKDGGGGAGDGTQVFYHRNLATYFLKRKEYARAAEQLLLANRRRRLPRNYQMLSEAYMGMGRTADAVEALREGLNAVEAKDPESVLWLVRIHLGGAGGRTAAEEEAERWESLTAPVPGLRDGIAGLLREAEGDERAARDLFWRSLRADPTRVVVAQRLYGLERERGAASDLEPLLRRALLQDPRIDEYHTMLGAILAERGRFERALESFRRAADLDPDNPRFASNLASALARLRRWGEAASAYERAASLAPSAEVYLRLGSVYRRLGRPGRALEAFERARELGDAGSAAYLGMALARSEMDQLVPAIEAAREGLERHPGDRALRSLYDVLIRRRRTPGSAPAGSGSGR
ncbi:MAG: alkaline phosphatase family protein [Acidobacteriota bacterium]